jgi:hypothetical protein
MRVECIAVRRLPAPPPHSTCVERERTHCSAPAAGPPAPFHSHGTRAYTLQCVQRTQPVLYACTMYYTCAWTTRLIPLTRNASPPYCTEPYSVQSIAVCCAIHGDTLHKVWSKALQHPPQRRYDYTAFPPSPRPASITGDGVGGTSTSHNTAYTAIPPRCNILPDIIVQRSVYVHYYISTRYNSVISYQI